MPEASKPRVLFVQSDVQAHGGRTAVFAWMLQALRENYDMSVFTWKPFDVRELNSHYGTALKAGDVRFLAPSPGLRWLAAVIEKIDPDPGSLQRPLLLARAARSRAASFDLTIGCEMESDWGIPGLQYIHYPWLERFYSEYAAADVLSPWQKLFGVVQGSVRPWQATGDFSFRRMRSNLTLTNSDWTGDRVRAAYDMPTVTLYPPAPGFFEPVSWSARENGFLAVGRVHPEKRMDWIIDALAPLRSEMPDMHLHLVGTVGTGKHEKRYFAALQRVVALHASWVTLHLNLSRAELAALAVQQRYGIHAMRNEHFGIAVAEMVLAGCIPFVHCSGGVREIINSEPHLLYDSAEELRARVLAVVRSEEAQGDLRGMLSRASARFSPEQFEHHFRKVVSGCLRAHGECMDDRVRHGNA